MRRTKEDAQVTRKIILDAALKVFYRNGYEATSISDICAEAGVTKGALYWHFESKEVLYIQMITENLKEIGRVIDYYRDMPLEPDEKLRKIYHSIFDMIIQNKNVHRAMEIAVSKTEGRSLSLSAEQIHEKERFLNFTDIIKEGIEKGIFRNELTPIQYNFYLNNIVGGLIWGSIRMPNVIIMAEWGPKIMQVTIDNVLMAERKKDDNRMQ
jgi:TetR/AcrR family acrAB operon transcriptional repressor